jgi:histidinol dehydrogenase
MMQIIDLRNDAGKFLPLKALLHKRKAQTGDNLSATVRGIIENVQIDGDSALVQMALKFDNMKINVDKLRISSEEINEIAADCAPDVRESLKFAHQRITDFHQRQLPKDFFYDDEYGNHLGMSWNAVDRAGIYVPGGKAAYPSSVLMNAIPARVAGVKQIAMCVPTPNGYINPAIMCAAQIAGVDEIYRIGGAGAIAAMAYGTQSIPPVNVIAGPGNAYVAEAKRQVFGVVGIDMVAGPSEITIIADGTVSAEWVAADLLSQAEHDELAQSILITNNEDYANQVNFAIKQYAANLPKSDIIQKSLQDFSAIFLVQDLQMAAELSNIIAPEHLELCVDAPKQLTPYLRHAGAIFSGAYTPEAIGDYVGGSSHVLPTMGAASYASGLSVYNFMKKTSHISCSKTGFTKLAKHGAVIADAEGLAAHALSLRIRGLS